MDIEIWKCIQICILRKKGGSDVVLTFYQVGNLNPIYQDLVTFLFQLTYIWHIYTYLLKIDRKYELWMCICVDIVNALLLSFQLEQGQPKPNPPLSLNITEWPSEILQQISRQYLFNIDNTHSENMQLITKCYLFVGKVG